MTVMEMVQPNVVMLMCYIIMVIVVVVVAYEVMLWELHLKVLY